MPVPDVYILHPIVNFVLFVNIYFLPCYSIDTLSSTYIFLLRSMRMHMALFVADCLPVVFFAWLNDSQRLVLRRMYEDFVMGKGAGAAGVRQNGRNAAFQPVMASFRVSTLNACASFIQSELCPLSVKIVGKVRQAPSAEDA